MRLDSEDIAAIHHAMEHLKKFQHGIYSFGEIEFFADGECLGTLYQDTDWNFVPTTK